MKSWRCHGMAWLPRNWKLVLAVGTIPLLVGAIITIGSSTGMIENRTDFKGELGDNFSTKTWNPFPPLKLDEGDEATFYFDMRPNAGLTAWGFFLYITNSTGQSVKTISRGSVSGDAARSIEIPFTATSTDIYQIRAYASSAPPSSLQIYPSVSVLKSGPDMMTLILGVALLVLGAILLLISLVWKPKQM